MRADLFTHALHDFRLSGKRDMLRNEGGTPQPRQKTYQRSGRVRESREVSWQSAPRGDLKPQSQNAGFPEGGAPEQG